jgi:hypothetical protein
VDSDADNPTFNSAMDSLLGSVIQDNFGNAANIDYNAIGSTSTVDARDNTNTNPNLGVGEPILLVDGDRVANDYNDLWDGDIDNPINIDSSNGPENDVILTGTRSNGRRDLNNFLGDSNVLAGSSDPSLGGSGVGWVEFIDVVSGSVTHFYGMSEPLTRANNQPTAVPFHTDTLPGLIAMGGLIFWRYRRQKRKAD